MLDDTKGLLDDEEENEDTQKDKYLTFNIGNEVYGFEIRFVTEIIGLQKITQVPDMSDYVKGVINLRGKIIPVLDIRLRFAMEEKEYSDRTCIIVADIQGTSIGLIVDEVSEVIDIAETQVDPPPKTGRGKQSAYIQGMGKVGDDVKILLNIEKLLQEKEINELEKLS